MKYNQSKPVPFMSNQTNIKRTPMILMLRTDLPWQDDSCKQLMPNILPPACRTLRLIHMQMYVVKSSCLQFQLHKLQMSFVNVCTPLKCKSKQRTMSTLKNTPNECVDSISSCIPSRLSHSRSMRIHPNPGEQTMRYSRSSYLKAGSA